MINPNDYIRYSNVVSSKYHFHYRDMEEVMKDFLSKLRQQNVTFMGPLFYSINNVPLDEKINGEFFMPILEDHFRPDDGQYFHSYYNVEDMVSMFLHNSNLEQDTEIVYKLLLEYMEENQLQQATPIYHILSGDHDFSYMMVKIGASQVTE